MNQVLTVSGLNFYIKSQLESDTKLKDIYIKGEIFSFHKHFKSGHLYFSLKDEKSAIKVVMFSSAAQLLPFEPKDGMMVLIRGSVSVYERDGAYQLYAKDMIPDGVGAEQLALQQLKQRLSDEGLFDIAKKRSLPVFPKRIAIITSKSGAAVKDVASVCSRRFPVAELYLFAVSVQGDTAKKSILWAFDKVNESFEHFDVCILTRGGGSQEDLWIFNDEEIVRAVAACRIPVISAIGHQIDTTLCDFAADQSAPTPSAAAEMATPDISDILFTLQHHKKTAHKLLSDKLTTNGLIIKHLQSRLNAVSPVSKAERAQMLLNNYSIAADTAIEKKILSLQADLDKFAMNLDLVNPLSILGKGYAKVIKDGKSVKSVKQITAGDQVEVFVNDGSVCCEVLTVNEV